MHKLSIILKNKYITNKNVLNIFNNATEPKYNFIYYGSGPRRYLKEIVFKNISIKFILSEKQVKFIKEKNKNIIFFSFRDSEYHLFKEYKIGKNKKHKTISRRRLAQSKKKPIMI